MGAFMIDLSLFIRGFFLLGASCFAFSASGNICQDSFDPIRPTISFSISGRMTHHEFLSALWNHRLYVALDQIRKDPNLESQMSLTHIAEAAVLEPTVRASGDPSFYLTFKNGIPHTLDTPDGVHLFSWSATTVGEREQKALMDILKHSLQEVSPNRYRILGI
jgi:hypothetical protein